MTTELALSTGCTGASLVVMGARGDSVVGNSVVAMLVVAMSVNMVVASVVAITGDMVVTTGI